MILNETLNCFPNYLFYSYIYIAQVSTIHWGCIHNILSFIFSVYILLIRKPAWMCQGFLVCSLPDNLPSKPIILTLQALSPRRPKQMYRGFTVSPQMVSSMSSVSKETWMNVERFPVCPLQDNLPSKPIVLNQWDMSPGRPEQM